MSKEEVPTISFDQAILEINKAAIGTQLVISIVSDYQHRGKMVVPVVSTFKLEVVQSSKPNLVDFLRKIHELTPILRIQFSKILSIIPPPQVQEFIKLLEKPCKSCGEGKPCNEDCSKRG